MARLKSLVIRAEIDEAVHAHNCQADQQHRITKGQKRLKVRKGRSWDHYCANCAKNMIQVDLKKLSDLDKGFDDGSTVRNQ